MADQRRVGERDISLRARLRHAWAILRGRAPMPAAAGSVETLLAGSVHEMPVGLLVTDAAQRIRYANPAFEALAGRPLAELLGAHPGQLLQGPGTSPEARARVRTALERGAPVAAELLNYRPDGTPYWIELHVVPVRGADGRVDHFVGVQLNVTARVEAAAAFESASTRWRDLAASLPLGIFELTADGTVLYANSRFATLTGCGPAEAIGSDWYVAVHQEDRRRVHALWDRAREAGKVMDTVLRSQTPAGVRWLQAMVTPIRADGGPLTGWFGSLQDITARMETEATLRAFFTEAQEARTLAEKRATEAAELVKELDAARNAALESVRLKSEFLANMSHEIRTPMNAIVGFSELLLDMPLGDVERDFAQTVRGAARNLLGLINDILDFSKIEAGQLTMEIAPFDLRHELDEIADLLAPRAHEKGVDLAVEVAADVPREFAADVQRVRQVVLNLAGNAVKFTERGHVRLVARMVPWPADGAPALRIDVEDTGIGIPDDKLEFVFGKFTQADGSTNRKFGGTGLGLAISRQLAQMMGGDVRASSALGVGSTFSFEAPLPVVSLAAEPAGAAVRVLLVDATSATGPAAARTLAAMGAEVLHLPSVPQAMAALQDLARSGQAFDLVVADARLVGLELAAVAEAARAGGAAPVFAAVSEPSALRVLEVAAGLGWSERLLRPIKRRDLVALLDRARAGVAARPAASAAARPEPARFGDVRVLVAEDNADNRRFASVVLEQFGCRVLLAEHGEEAVARWSADAPDLILMDCMMPGLDGFEATRAIRSREGDGHRTPIVALTANAMAGDRERCLAAGMDDYLSKPFKRAELAAVLARWLPEGAIRA